MDLQNWFQAVGKIKTTMTMAFTRKRHTQKLQHTFPEPCVPARAAPGSFGSFEPRWAQSGDCWVWNEQISVKCRTSINWTSIYSDGLWNRIQEVNMTFYRLNLENKNWNSNSDAWLISSFPNNIVIVTVTVLFGEQWRRPFHNGAHCDLTYN